MTTCSCLARTALASLVLLCSPIAAALAPTSAGFPDPTYGFNGALTFGVRTGFESANAMVPTPDGKWLVTGGAQAAGGSDNVRYLMRLQPDGRPDLSFGTQGFVTDNSYNSVIAVQASGKILAVAGVSGGGFLRAALRRLNADGSRDLSFGVANGQTVLDTVTAQFPSQGFDYLEIDGQGRILGATRVYAGLTASRVEVWRFSAEGIPDATFGSQGSVSITDIPPNAYNSVVRQQADGRIVVAMWCQAAGSGKTDLCMIRFNANGTRDASFGPNGLRQVSAPAGVSYPIYDLRIDASGKLYVAGTSFSFNGAVAVVFRFNSDGTPDAGYGQAGIAKLAFTGETAYVFRIRLLPDGRQIAIGSVLVSNDQSYGYVARLTATGQLDASFGNAGISPRVSSQAHWFNEGAVLADGAILGIGFLTTVPGAGESFDSLLARIVGVETTTLVIEFHNVDLNHYFITADPVEAASIDAGASGPGWSRTGKTWKSGGPSRVCRNYGSPEINPATGTRRGPNSHVYSIEASECLAIRADPGWRFESYDFSGWLRTAATCPAGTTGVMRAYNNRFAQNDSNHRYTVELAVYNAMLALGWTGEGVVFCAVL